MPSKRKVAVVAGVGAAAIIGTGAMMLGYEYNKYRDRRDDEEEEDDDYNHLHPSRHEPSRHRHRRTERQPHYDKYDTGFGHAHTPRYDYSMREEYYEHFEDRRPRYSRNISSESAESVSSADYHDSDERTHVRLLTQYGETDGNNLSRSIITPSSQAVVPSASSSTFPNDKPPSWTWDASKQRYYHDRPEQRLRLFQDGSQEPLAPPALPESPQWHFDAERNDWYWRNDKGGYFEYSDGSRIMFPSRRNG